MPAKVSVGAGHAREHKGTGIGFFMFPEPERSPAWRLYALGSSYILWEGAFRQSPPKNSPPSRDIQQAHE